MTRCALAWGFVALVTSLAAAAADTWAQQQERVAIVGRLAVIGGLNDPVNEAIRKGLRELGYVEGRDFRIEQRSAEGHIDQLPRAAEELVRLKADVIVTGTEISTRAARQATSTTPIVAIIPDEDPVVSGLIDFDAAFRTAKRQKAGAVMLLSSPQVYIRRAQLGTLALENKLPADAPFRDFTLAGGLMSYSTDVIDGFYHSAYLIDRLLKGAKASDLPFEQTATIRLVVNLKTAKALGIAIPQSILVRADEVIR